MRDLWRTASRSAYIPFLEKLSDTVRAFSASGRLLFFFFAGLCVISSMALLYMLNNSLLVATPATGGSLREGIVGSPRFINPVLAISDADRDLSTLIYSGLLKAAPEGGYVADLAAAYDISPDGKIYTVTLRDDITFHNGLPVTADDVLFTIAQTQNATLKSPRRANWDGVIVEKTDDYTVRFTLENAYAPFIENLTLGILPKNLWQDVSAEEFAFSDLNVSPVGSGPFRVASISRSASGIPSSYELRPFTRYALGRPYLNTLLVRFYQNEQAVVDALINGEIDSAGGISPASLSQLREFPVERTPLNRVFGIFFNQNQSAVLRDADVRAALESAIDRNELIQKVFYGYATVLTEPVPSRKAYVAATEVASSSAPVRAQEELIASGWELKDGILVKTTGTGKNAKTVTLSFTLSTGNVPELRAAAEYVRTAWSAMGAQVEVQIFDQGDLSQNVIRPRKYDALLFGEVIGRELDLYAFWHSSQRNDPGLNIALYANSSADTLLEQMRTTSDASRRAQLYAQFLTELKKDTPAIFLYAPDFVYSIPNDIQGFMLGSIETPSDRFLSAPLWHRQTDYVWPIFAGTNTK